MFKNKIATPDGYSRIFSAMLEMADINSEPVNGWIMGLEYFAVFYKDYSVEKPLTKNFRFNHWWNKVEIENVWYLTDLTFAAGNLSAFHNSKS